MRRKGSLFAEAEASDPNLNRLESGQTLECGSAEELRQVFSGMAPDYMTAQDPFEEKPRQRAANVYIDPTALAAAIKERIVGQDAQIDGLAMCVCNHLKKKDPKKPLTVMLPGPTGTGKTATAKCLAEELQKVLGKENFPFILINCNEMREGYRISQLIGSPAGYVGYGDKCVMEPLRKTSTALIVFDEYEKAASDIHTAVMNWMDSGRVTLSRAKDGEEAELDCAGSVIVLTSNIDMSVGKRTRMRFDTGEGADVAERASDSDRCRKAMVANGFRPEIAGRVSYFFEFNELSAADIRKITELTLCRKAAEYGLNVTEVSSPLLDALAERYGIGTFGVRVLESDLDRLIGEKVTEAPDADAEYALSGTPDDITVTRREA